jgi:hypothetical protein
MESFIQDVLFYALCAWIAYVLLNDSSGGGKRDRVGSAA